MKWQCPACSDVVDEDYFKCNCGHEVSTEERPKYLIEGKELADAEREAMNRQTISNSGYNIYLRLYPDQDFSQGKYKAVKNGFSWSAMLFGTIWAWINGMVGVGLCLLFLAILLKIVGAFLGAIGGGAGAIFSLFLIDIPVLVWIGKSGNNWKKSSLEKKGYKLMQANAPASSPSEAIQIYKSKMSKDEYRNTKKQIISTPTQNTPTKTPINWRLNRTKDGKITQIVFKSSVSSVKKTEFGMIVFPANKFPILSSHPWCTGFVRMGGKPIPYQMLRVDEFDEEVKKSDLTIALAFCKLSSGSIFLIDTRIENESLINAVRRKFPEVPPISKPIAEWVVGIDDGYSLEMIQDVFSSSVINVIVANSNGAHTKNFDNYGNAIDSVGPAAHHERSISLDPEVTNLLKNELKSLVDYHNSLPNSSKNFRQAGQELCTLMPIDKDPIFPKDYRYDDYIIASSMECSKPNEKSKK